MFQVMFVETNSHPQGPRSYNLFFTTVMHGSTLLASACGVLRVLQHLLGLPQSLRTARAMELHEKRPYQGFPRLMA